MLNLLTRGQEGFVGNSTGKERLQDPTMFPKVNKLELATVSHESHEQGPPTLNSNGSNNLISNIPLVI